MDAELPSTAVAEILAQQIAALDPARLPPQVRGKCEDLLIDVVGLCLTARKEDYVAAALAGWDDDGPCTGYVQPLLSYQRATAPLSIRAAASLG